jgi:hypothetical protein
MTENLLSVWIWLRERMDVELINHTTAIVAESKLMTVRDNIEKNKDRNICEQEALMTELRSKARACKGVTAKEQRVAKLRKLLPTLQRCKRLRKQNALANQQLSLLDLQINAFENGRFQKQMTDTLRASVVAMKKVGISEDNVGDVDTMVLDMEDTISQQTQISESLASTLVNTMDESSSSDDSLMRELMLLMGDDEDAATAAEAGDDVSEGGCSGVGVAAAAGGAAGGAAQQQHQETPLKHSVVPVVPVVLLPPTPVSVMREPLPPLVETEDSYAAGVYGDDDESGAEAADTQHGNRETAAAAAAATA